MSLMLINSASLFVITLLLCVYHESLITIICKTAGENWGKFPNYIPELTLAVTA